MKTRSGTKTMLRRCLLPSEDNISRVSQDLRAVVHKLPAILDDTARDGREVLHSFAAEVVQQGSEPHDELVLLLAGKVIRAAELDKKLTIWGRENTQVSAGGGGGGPLLCVSLCRIDLRTRHVH
jgi:hypothetical protein